MGQMMKVKINGSDQNINVDKISISEILELNKVKSPEMVSVQLNRKFIGKENYDKTFIKQNDEVDFLFFMGGGC